MGLWAELLSLAGELARGEAGRLGRAFVQAAEERARPISRSIALGAAGVVLALAALGFAVAAMFVALQDALGTVAAALLVSGALLAVALVLWLARRR
jgi:hypothetical protein